MYRPRNVLTVTVIGATLQQLSVLEQDLHKIVETQLSNGIHGSFGIEVWFHLVFSGFMNSNYFQTIETVQAALAFILTIASIAAVLDGYIKHFRSSFMSRKIIICLEATYCREEAPDKIHSFHLVEGT